QYPQRELGPWVVKPKTGPLAFAIEHFHQIARRCVSIDPQESLAIDERVQADGLEFHRRQASVWLKGPLHDQVASRRAHSSSCCLASSKESRRGGMTS